MRRSRSVSRRGFTLIELMIVVTIIGIIAAIAIPAMLSVVKQEGSSGGDDAEVTESIAQEPPRATTVDATTGEAGLAAEIVSSDIAVSLRAFEVLEGFSVVTHYDVDFVGEFVIRNPDPAADRVQVVFPFPPGISEARDVALLLGEGESSWREADAAVYTLDGVEWSGAVAPGGQVRAQVRYRARGRAAFGYDVAGTGRSGEVRFEMNLENVERPVVPPDALQPTEQSEDRLAWSFEKLITNDAIRLELPPGSSPLGRIIFLCQLAGLAVLLFGGGFWFLGEGYRPRMLDDFRWGHFLLLALNFALFFGIFAVIAYDASPVVAGSVASLVSLPLLTLHVRRVVDTRFALTRNLPLAVFSLGVVIAAVYLESVRAYVFLGSGVFVVAFVTVRYASWSAGRKAAEEAWERKRQRARREQELSGHVEQLKVLRGQLEPWVSRGESLLDRASAELERDRREVGAALDAARGVLDAVRSWEPEDAEAIEEADEHARVVRMYGVEASAYAGELMDVESGLREAVARLEAEQEVLESALREEEDRLGAVRQRAQVQHGVLSQRVGEGDESAEAQRLVGVLAELRAVLEREVEWEASALTVRRMQMEDVRRELERGLERVASAQAAFEQRREQERERARVERGEEEARHCLACGSTRDGGSRYCPDCGTARPLVVVCARCGSGCSLPLHLLEPRWSAEPLHCEWCGAEHARAQLPEPPPVQPA